MEGLLQPSHLLFILLIVLFIVVPIAITLRIARYLRARCAWPETQLRGWKRIGIIASVVWILGAGSFTACAVLIPNFHRAGSLTSTVAQVIFAEFVVLVPVPLGWGFASLILFLVYWVKRGFSPTHN
jgi:hypothetical protein